MSDIKIISGKIVNHNSSFLGTLKFNNKILNIENASTNEYENIIIPNIWNSSSNVYKDI